MSMGLRITIVTSDVPNYRIPFLRELALQGSDVHVVAAGKLANGFVTGALPAEVSATRLRPRAMPRVRIDVIRNLLESAPDVIVSEHAARHDYIWTTLLAPQLRRIPRVLWTHGVARQELYGGVRDAASIGRWLQIDLADAVLCYEAHGEALVQAARPHKKVGHLNNSTDGFALRAEFDALASTPRHTIRKRLGIRPDAAVICGLGRLVAEKQFIRLVSVLALVQRIRPDTQLVLIGDGPEMPKIQQRVDAAGVRDHVVFAGSVRGARELAPWLFASDVSVSPAAIGLSVVDALFAGLPTITPAPAKAGPHHGPEYHYLEPGKTALITDENSDDALARACVELFELPYRARAAMSQACAQFATSNLGVARMATAMNEFVSGVVHARTTTSRNQRFA